MRTNRTIHLWAATVAALLLVAGGDRVMAADQVLVLSGSTGGGYAIEGSNDLQTWTVVRTVENLTGALEIQYSELGNYAYYRVSHAGASELRAIGLAIYEEVSDPAQLEQLKNAARDRALEVIANEDAQLTPEQINSLFSSFATQEAFNAALATVDPNAAAVVSRESIERIVGILSNSSAGTSATELDAIRTLALSTGLTGGIISSGGSQADATAAVTTAAQELSAAVQQATAQTAQAAAIAAIAAQLTGADSQQLLKSINDALASLLGGSGATGGLGGSIGTGGGLSSWATAILNMLGAGTTGGIGGSSSSSAAGTTGSSSGSTGGNAQIQP